MATHSPTAEMSSETMHAVAAGKQHRYIQAATYFLAAMLTLSCIVWALEVPQRLGYAFYTEQFLALILGLALAVAFHSFNVRSQRHGAAFPAVDVALGLLGLGTGMWVAVEYPRLLLEVSFRTVEILVISVIIILLVLEALRRCTGWALLSVVLFFFLYALVAHLMPESLRGKPVKLDALVSYLAFDPSAIYGSPMVVGSTVVIMFIWMGEVLIRSGGGAFFIDIAMAFFGKRRGGPAKICVVGSALFGTISGSAVSNVAAVGVLTIPMMKRTGYKATEAGAIEAVGSTGGQLMPPVMGAAAFLMAEFLQITYAEVCIAAAVPAILYYWGLYCQVDLIAGKRRLGALTEALPIAGEVLRDGWHLVLPFGVLIFAMFYWESAPEVAGIAATVAIFVVGMLRSYRGHRLKPSDIFGSLAGTGRTTTDLFTTLAAAGLVIGILNLTGLSFALTLFLVKVGGDSIVVLLILAGLISIILGMGMPTTAVYVLVATLMAPSLVQAGLTKMAAHMFLLYFGMLSMITPPVALAAFAAANISGAGAMETGWMACRVGWTKFVIPFMFVLSPTLLMIGSTQAIVFDFISAFIGIYLVTVAMVGFFQRDIDMAKRIILALCGLIAIVPGFKVGGMDTTIVSLAAMAIGIVVLGMEYRAVRRTAPAAP
ncbi:MAG: TRAP transporter permease [Rhodospirillales bacterium]